MQSAGGGVADKATEERNPSPALQEMKRSLFFNLNKFIDHTTNLIPEEVLREEQEKGE